MQHHSHDHSHEHSVEQHTSRWLTRLALGGLVTTGVVIAAPYVLPAVGIGSAAMAQESMWVLHNAADAGGSGLAGLAGGLLSKLPLVGETLAAGGLYNALATGVVGIGGVLLGNYVAKREDGSKKIKWGNVIKTAALVASALIALPTVLTSLGYGIIFLSTLAGDVAIANSAIEIVGSTIGTMAGMDGAMFGASGIAAAVPHFITCGASIIPAAIGLSMFGSKKQKPASVAAEIAVDQPTQAGRPCQAILKLRDAQTNKPITTNDLATVHTEKIHLLVIDQSLKDYHHIHPQPTDIAGEYRFTFTPNTSNAYSAWADITLCKTKQNIKIKSAIDAANPRNIPPVIRPSEMAEAKGIQAKIVTDRPMLAGKASMVRASLSDVSGRPIRDLEPVMGAYAHLVGFSADGNSIIHCHPLGEEPSDKQARGGPDLLFHVEPQQSGPTQFYLQLKRNGEDVYLPFGALIQKQEPSKSIANYADRMKADNGALLPVMR